MLTLEAITIKELYNLDGTLAKDLLKSKIYPWEVLPAIGEYIRTFAPTLSDKEYELYPGKDGKYNVWISKTAKVAPTASITIVSATSESFFSIFSGYVAAPVITGIGAICWELTIIFPPFFK